MAGGNRSAAAKKAWITRRGGLSATARARVKRIVGQAIRTGDFIRGGATKPTMTAKEWGKKFSAGEVMMNGRPMRDFFTTRGTRRK